MQLLVLVHFLLNVAGLLLWLRWREERLLSARRAGGGTLLATLRKAGRTPVYRWSNLGLLVGLVLVRALAYWHMGSAIGWTPAIGLGAIVLSFRSDFLGRMVLFSLASLVVFIAEFYFWLLLISVINRKVSDADPWQNRVRAHLGWIERWPAGLKLLLPFLLTAMVWAGLAPLLARLGFQLPAKSMSHTIQQAGVLGLASYLVWKYLMVGLLLSHLVTSYVYLGNAPFWTFINHTGRNLLWPIRWMPLRLGQIDLAPAAAAALVLFLGELGLRELPKLYARLPLW
ncbi:MAG: hypothetical protein NTW03_04520 [Verrucomicrobia bacterium]|nr:hypothetical protein [Verrucomicrobiota bacterium]